MARSPLWAVSFLILIFYMFVTACSEERYVEVVDVNAALSFGRIEASGKPDYEAILATYQNVVDLHTMTFRGDFDELIEGRHRQIMLLYQAYPEGVGKRRGCSMFRYGNGPGGLVGRNFDNRYSELLAAYYYPADGYASLSFVPLMEIGYSRDNPFDPDNISNRRSLLVGPALTIEGMNEKGVTVTLASLGRQKVRQDPDRQPRFLLYLVRDILDHAGDLEEAIAIAAGYNVFDNGLEIISHHIFLADPAGSAVLEWCDGKMEVVRDDGNRQAVTNSTMFEVPEKQRRRNCGRYRSLGGSLDDQEGDMDWQQGMDALVRTAQHNKHYYLDGENVKISTQWSTVFDLDQMTAYVCLNRDYSRVYRLELPTPPAGK